jgi:hypothetical protein
MYFVNLRVFCFLQMIKKFHFKALLENLSMSSGCRSFVLPDGGSLCWGPTGNCHQKTRCRYFKKNLDPILRDLNLHTTETPALW